jgi:hypothetical protein
MLSLFLVACGDSKSGSGGAGGGSGGAGGGTGRYLPTKTGAHWTYKVTDPATGVSTQNQTVMGIEAVPMKPGVMAFHVQKVEVTGTTDRWEEDKGAGTGIVRDYEKVVDPTGARRYEELYDPFRFHVDETPAHTAMGATWMEVYTEKHWDPLNCNPCISPRNVMWTVEATAEMVTVPAGTFPCLRLKRVTPGDTPDYYWFSRGVGKVKEVHKNMEELMSFSIPP